MSTEEGYKEYLAELRAQETDVLQKALLALTVTMTRRGGTSDYPTCYYCAKPGHFFTGVCNDCRLVIETDKSNGLSCGDFNHYRYLDGRSSCAQCGKRKAECDHNGAKWENCACPKCGKHNVDGRRVQRFKIEVAPGATTRQLLAYLADEERTASRPEYYGSHNALDAAKKAEEIHETIVNRLKAKLGDKVEKWGLSIESLLLQNMTLLDGGEQMALAKIMPQVADMARHVMREMGAKAAIAEKRHVRRMAKLARMEARHTQERSMKFFKKTSNRFSHI